MRPEAGDDEGRAAARRGRIIERERERGLKRNEIERNDRSGMEIEFKKKRNKTYGRRRNKIKSQPLKF